MENVPVSKGIVKQCRRDCELRRLLLLLSRYNVAAIYALTFRYGPFRRRVLED